MSINLRGRGSRELWSKEVMFEFSEQSSGGRGPHSSQPNACSFSKPTLDTGNRAFLWFSFSRRKQGVTVRDP